MNWSSRLLECSTARVRGPSRRSALPGRLRDRGRALLRVLRPARNVLVLDGLAPAACRPSASESCVLNGASTVVIAAGEEPGLAATWEDSGYSDTSVVIGEEVRYAGYPEILTVGGSLWARLFGIDLNEHRPIDAVAKIGERPLMIVHGVSDHPRPAPPRPRFRPRPRSGHRQGRSRPPRSCPAGPRAWRRPSSPCAFVTTVRTPVTMPPTTTRCPSSDSSFRSPE